LKNNVPFNPDDFELEDEDDINVEKEFNEADFAKEDY